MALPGKQKAPWQEEAGFRLQKALADRAQVPLCLRCCVEGGGRSSLTLGVSPPAPTPTAPPLGLAQAPEQGTRGRRGGPRGVAGPA